MVRPSPGAVSTIKDAPEPIMFSPYTPLDYGLDETLVMLRDQVNAFARDEIAPRAGEIDEKNEFPADLWHKS